MFQTLVNGWKSCMENSCRHLSRSSRSGVGGHHTRSDRSSLMHMHTRKLDGLALTDKIEVSMQQSKQTILQDFYDPICFKNVLPLERLTLKDGDTWINVQNSLLPLIILRLLPLTLLIWLQQEETGKFISMDTILSAAGCGAWVAFGYLGQTLGLLTTT